MGRVCFSFGRGFIFKWKATQWIGFDGEGLKRINIKINIKLLLLAVEIRNGVATIKLLAFQ